MQNRSIRWTSALAALCLAGLALADGKVCGVSTDKVGEGVEIVIHGKALSRPRIILANSGTSYILEFHADLVGSKGYTAVGSPAVDHVNWAWYRAHPKLVRVHVKMTKRQYPTLKHDGADWTVLVHEPHADAKPVATTPAIAPLHTKAAAVVPHSAIAVNVKPSGMEPNAPQKALHATADAKATTKVAETAKPEVTEPKDPTKATSTAIEPKPPTRVAEVVKHTPTHHIKRAVHVSSKTPRKHVTKSQWMASAAQKAAGPTVFDSHATPPVDTVESIIPAVLQKRVSLDFSNTDVVQILKALALQAGVNIVTSPEVKGTISVSLSNVTVKDALDLVSAMANLRYGKLGSTFVVASPARYSELMRQMSGNFAVDTTTVVLPLYSGMGTQIKAAVFKALPIETERGRYDLILPSEETQVKQSNEMTPDTTPDAKGGADSGAQMPTYKTSIETKSGKDTSRDAFILIVGSQSRLAEVERLVKELDKQIARSMFLDVPDETNLADALYTTTANSAQSLIRAICEPSRIKDLTDQPNQTLVHHVQVYASAGLGGGGQIIVMHGPADEVTQLKDILGQIDVPMLGTDVATVYEVKFADPRALKDDLSSQFPGLVVSIPPASAGNPLLYKKGDIRGDVATQLSGFSSKGGGTSGGSSSGGASSGSSGGATTPSAGASGSGGASGGSSGSSGNEDPLGVGLTLPFSDLEPMAFPMRLVLRGSKSQVDSAMDYLKLVDVAPKQVALEMRVMELSKEDAINAGIDWNLFTGGAVKFIRLNNSPTTAAGNSTGININTGGVRGDVLAQLDKTVVGSKLIARPNVVAIDGRQTELFVGDVIRYVESIISSQNGITVTTGSVRVGVRMAVLPRVGASHTITLDLRPTVSFLRSFTEVKQIGGQLPQTSERTAQETLNLKSGETIAIGGLIQDQDRKTYKGVPFLMDLPIVGKLFRSTNTDKVKTELVIFLTAKEIDGPLDAQGSPLGTQGLSSANYGQYDNAGKGGK